MQKNQPKNQPGNLKIQVMERQFQSTVVEMAKAFGWECFYIPDSAKSGVVGRPKGWPDLTLCHPEMAILVFAELKSDNAKSQPTPDQVKWLTILDNCGEMVQLWRPRMWDHIENVLAGPSAKTWKALHASGPWDEWG